MKVEFKPAISNQKIPVNSKIEKFFSEGRVKLKTLVNDAFEKKVKSNKIVARKEPNWCQTDEDMPNKAVINLDISFDEANAPLKEIGLDLNDFIRRS